MSKRIVHFTSVHLWHDTRIYRRICRSLVGAGYEVHLVATTDGTPGLELHEGVHVHLLPQAGSRWGRIVSTARAVTRRATELDAAIYHFHDPELIPAARKMAKGGRIVVYDVHEDLPKDVVNKEWLPRLLGQTLMRPLDWLETTSSSRFSAVVAAETAIAERFQGAVPHTITLNNYPSLQDFPRPSSGNRLSPPTLVHFGGLSQLRAIEPLVDALGMIPPEVEVRLLAAGRCESEAMMTRLQTKPGWRRVEYLGWLSHDELRQHLGESTLAMILLSDAPNHHRVRSNRFFESLACATPVVTANFPAWRQLVHELGCGVAVDSADPTAIRDAILHVLEHPDEARQMGRRGRSAIEERFNWESEFESLLQLYERLLERTTVA